MALSNDTKLSIDNYKALLDIATAFGVIMDDPKGFLKIIKDANTLSDTESAKVQKARDFIDTYQAQLTELAKKEADNDAFRDRLDQNNKDLVAAIAAFNKREIELNKRDIITSQKEAELAGISSNLDDKAKKLQAAQDQLAADNASLDSREKSLDDKEEKLNAKYAQLTGVING